ncbi:MAG: tRNA (adenosine(37)-N6)-threonylcarbamoyltransferase complex transferase subunit TsaD [Verrucomicrobiae bacterium]|nr:tRNA (adenosine(37)-N6)-threonylcarbamoyltransferase complex transferase subunit TsaD [Verrucomicrobiae bacterium]
MRVLAIETSCDETSVAVVSDGAVLANVVSSQTALHAEYGGVVPELAAREHLRNLPPVVRLALEQARLEASQIDAVAATRGPGLPQALLIGVRAAQSFAFARHVPFLGVHHHEAHLFSPWIGGDPLRADFTSFEPGIALIASGGHTVLVHLDTDLRHRVLGSTLDDAAGECFDKVAKLIGLPYPGGPWVDRLAAEGNPEAHPFPRPLLRSHGDDFSFSGLKTSVRTFLDKHPDVAADPAGRRDLCASVQAAIIEVLVGKLVAAAIRLRLSLVSASGGVTCNRGFRALLATEAARHGLRVRLAEPALCTDNAAMVGVLAERRLARGESTPYDAEIRPSWPLDEAWGDPE